VAAANLQANGLRYDRVDTSDAEQFDTWLQAVWRGFNGNRREPDMLTYTREKSAHHRVLGIWDDSGADPHTPIATVSTWIADLTVPGRRTVPAWAISTVTVAPSHRRRGAARNLLEAELRTAAKCGVPVAMLTVSEATIYGRYGFAPSTIEATWRIDTTRTHWAGPMPAGRLQLVPNDVVMNGGGWELFDSVRLDTPGQIYIDGSYWERLFGAFGSDERDRVRVVRYDDESGVPKGFASYLVKSGSDGAGDQVHVKYLVATTDDAYAALWRYLIEIDLTDAVVADQRPTEEPVVWQLSNFRAAVKSNERDHLWTRILDVRVALGARSYATAGRIVIDVSDDLGFAAGRFALEVDADGVGVATATSDSPDLALGVAELSAVYLGGVSLAVLQRAGRIDELRSGAVSIADSMFRSDTVPWLGSWF
jgi:predicted acetyltransferase